MRAAGGDWVLEEECRKAGAYGTGTGNIMVEMMISHHDGNEIRSINIIDFANIIDFNYRYFSI